MAKSETSPTSVFWAAAQRRDSMELVMTVGGVMLSGVLVFALGLMLQEANYYSPCESFSISGVEVRDTSRPVLWHAPESPLMNGDSAR